MTKQIVNLGTSANSNNGDPLRTAFNKINSNFDEVYTLLGAGATGTISSVVGPLFNHSNHNNLTVTLDPVLDQIVLNADFTGSNLNVSSLSGNVTGNVTGDLKGSVVGDDSTVLVDGVNSTIPWTGISGVPTTISGLGVTDVYTKTEIDNSISQVTSDHFSFAITSDDSTVVTVKKDDTIQFKSGSNLTSATDADGNVTYSLNSQISADLTGSVFADDSTILINGVDGTIQADHLVGTLPAIDGSNLTGVTASISSLDLDELADISYDPVNDNGPPSFSFQPLVWDSVASKWMPGYAVTANTLTANTRIQLNGNGSEIEWVDDTSNGGVQPYYRTRVRFNGTITQDHTITFPDATGTVALTSQLYTDLDVDAHLNQYNPTAGYVLSWTGSDYAWVAQSGGGTGDTQGSVFADDSTLLVDGTNGTINSSALTKPIALGDNEKITFGDDDDLEIHHTGGVNYIAGAGGTIITGNWLYLRKPGSAENYLICKADGAVELYHDNVKKLETTADGISVTGKITGLTDPTAAQDAATKAYVDANSGGGGSQTRSTVTGTTSSLADAAEADLDITGFKSYMLLTITTDRAARVRLYVNAATRTSDASRAEGVDPTSDAGLIAEVITTGADTVIISPGAYGFNLEGTPTTTIPCRVTNKSGGASTVQVDLNILQLEA